MSIRRTLRARFMNDADKQKLANDELTSITPDVIKDEPYLLVEHTENSSSATEALKEVEICGAGGDDWRVATSIESGFKDGSEKLIFELQLNQLQEQLMSSAVENRALRAKLADYEETVVDVLKHDLSQERSKVSLLEKRLKSKNGSEQSSPKLKPRTSANASSEDEAPLVVEEIAVDEITAVMPEPVKRNVLLLWFITFIHEFLEDISETSETLVVLEGDGEALTVKRLKESIKRFGAAIKPYINTVKGLYNLVTWKSPAYTLLIFVLYMYSLWRGYLVSLVFCLLIVRLSINFLNSRGWLLNINFLDAGKDDKDTDEDLGVSDKLNLVLSVARKVQNMLMTAADGLEKIKSLLCWRHASTRKLFSALSSIFLLSLVFTPSSVFHLVGYYLGIKFFIIDYVYNRYPRLKHKYDTTHRIWLDLPTDALYEKILLQSSEFNKYVLVPEGTADVVHPDEKTFAELFTLPSKETPISGWVSGKRCSLINKNKPITGGGVKNGLLFLTKSYLCFLRSKTPNSKNVTIALSAISYIERAKPYSWMPGKGFAMEIGITDRDKVYIFGALVNRDEVMEGILAAGKKLQLAWAYTE